MSSNELSRLGLPPLLASRGGTAWRNTTSLLLALALSACDQSPPPTSAAGGPEATSNGSENVASEPVQEKKRVQLVAVVPEGAPEVIKTTSRVVTEALDLNAFPGLSEFSAVWGPELGSMAPTIAAQDHTGQAQTLASLAGERGLLLVFSRSADW